MEVSCFARNIYETESETSGLCYIEDLIFFETALKDGKRGAGFENFFGAVPRAFTYFIIVISSSSNGNNNNGIIIIIIVIMIIIKALFKNIWPSHA